MLLVLRVQRVLRLFFVVESAGVRGVVREVIVDNAAAVEHGQVLMVIEPKP